MRISATHTFAYFVKFCCLTFCCMQKIGLTIILWNAPSIEVSFDDQYFNSLSPFCRPCVLFCYVHSILCFVLLLFFFFWNGSIAALCIEIIIPRHWVISVLTNSSLLPLPPNLQSIYFVFDLLIFNAFDRVSCLLILHLLPNNALQGISSWMATPKLSIPQWEFKSQALVQSNSNWEIIVSQHKPYTPYRLSCMSRIISPRGIYFFFDINLINYLNIILYASCTLVYTHNFFSISL